MITFLGRLGYAALALFMYTTIGVGVAVAIVRRGP